jgi:Holliday junction resolvase RusA-like endonuclease
MAKMATGPARQRSLIVERGASLSKEVVRKSLSGGELFLADDGWMAAFKIPFSFALSKNHVWSMARGGGHVFKREQARKYQDFIALKAKECTRGLTIYRNKIWIDLFVQKPNHKGDAINIVDSVCDGLKVGLGIDDRWFCIRQLDWEIAKDDPQVFVKIFQRDCFDALACSHCGRILAMEHFGKKKSSKLGVDRACRVCRGSKPVAEAA